MLENDKCIKTTGKTSCGSEKLKNKKAKKLKINSSH